MKRQGKQQLDAEEKEILKSVEEGDWVPAKDAKSRLKRYQQYARAMQKDQRVNIRLSSSDLAGIQRRALREGIPYQTLMSSVLHKYVSGILTEKAA